MSEEPIVFNEELESYWVTYSNNFNLRFKNKGSLDRFKKFINKEPSKHVVLKRISTAILDFDEISSMKKLYNLLKYIHYDFSVNIAKYVSQTEKYRELNLNNDDDEVFYNKLVLLRCMKDGQSFLKIFSVFYDYYVNSISSAYEIATGKKFESTEELFDSFESIYIRIDLNIRMYHYDYYLDIYNILNKAILKIINAIYEDQSGCCVATPTFNTLDIMVETFRNLNRVLTL
jgi:hypothetical protein